MACAAVVILLVAGGQSSAGHQIGHYPSYYPDEIRIDVLDEVTAGLGLADETLHAYVGAAPVFSGAMPRHVRSVDSLGSFLVISFNSDAAEYASATARCAAARNILAVLREKAAGGFVFHPYPVTPYHSDYLHHLDRVRVALAAGAGRGASSVPITIGARGQLAESVVRAHWGSVAARADVVIESVPVDELVAAGDPFGFGPTWQREGWYHAYRLLAPRAPQLPDTAIEDDLQRLIHGEFRDLAERANLERHMVSALARGCERVVAGYAPRQEFYGDNYPSGIENVGYDSLLGLNAPIFLRTVKLKEYPWNGKLNVAVHERSQAAWNPVAGFSDALGRLIWSAVADPAMIAVPFNASWMANRVQSEVSRVVGQSGGIAVPADALRPKPGSGALMRVGERNFGSIKVVHEVLASPFNDGSEMMPADLLYPYAFIYRWGVDGRTGDVAREPRLRGVLEIMQERLAGIRVVRVEKTAHAVAEGLDVVWRTPVVEVYLRDAPGDERQAAALAAPWSPVPWHLLALMEEAVNRGYAAFSAEEAARRGVAWLDLVRDPVLRAKLLELIVEFEREAYRPEPLRELVTADEAQARWRALKSFAERHGHLLVTNGPYRLKQWGPHAVVLEVVRELSYPLGFGTFDRFVNPPRAVIDAATLNGGEIVVRAHVEMVLKAGRGYRFTREPLSRTTTRGVNPLLVVSRYLLLDSGGKVVALDKMHWQEDATFSVKIPEHLPAGGYKAMLAVFLDGNAQQPSTTMLDFRVNEKGSPQDSAQ